MMMVFRKWKLSSSLSTRYFHYDFIKQSGRQGNSAVLYLRVFSCRISRTPQLQVLFNTNNGKRETNRTISLQGNSLICPVFLQLREVKSVSGFRSVISLVSATLYVVFKCLVVAAFSWISWRRSKKSGNNPDLKSAEGRLLKIASTPGAFQCWTCIHRYLSNTVG